MRLELVLLRRNRPDLPLPVDLPPSGTDEASEDDSPLRRSDRVRYSDSAASASIIALPFQAGG